MKRQIFVFAAVLLFSNPSFAQQQGPRYGNEDVKNTTLDSSQTTQVGMRKVLTTTTSTRIFAYDAAGNRILMYTPTRNNPSSPAGDQTLDDQVCISMTSGLLEVNLSVPSNEPYSISVYNIVGQLLTDRKNCRGMSQEINLSHLERGVYVIDVCAGKHHCTKKITIE